MKLINKKQKVLYDDTRELLLQDIEQGNFDVSSYCDNPEELIG